MDSLKRLAASAVVPVVVLDDAKDAVATAKALLAGGVDVMEIRTSEPRLDGNHVPHGGCGGFDQGGRGKLPRYARRCGHGHHARPVPQGRRVRREVHRCPRL